MESNHTHNNPRVTIMEGLYVSGTDLSACHVRTCLMLTATLVGDSMSPILKIKKLRQREVTYLPPRGRTL